MKRKMKTIRNVLLAVVLVLIAVIAVMLVSIGRQKQPEEPQTKPTVTVAETVEAETAPTEVEVTVPVVRSYEIVEPVNGEIHTPYGTLTYPQGLSDHLLIACTSRQPYVLEFYAVMEDKQELRLFDLALGEDSGGNLGTAMTTQGEVSVDVTLYELNTDETWTEGELLTASAMQEAVNELIGQLAPSAEETRQAQTVIHRQPEEDSSVHNLEIETPHGKLYYPARWADMVTYFDDDSQEGVYKVFFHSRMEGREDQLLFALYFGGDEGEQLGAVMGAENIPVPVYLVMNQLHTEGWEPAEAEELFSMQEAANQLVARLPLLQ